VWRGAATAPRRGAGARARSDAAWQPAGGQRRSGTSKHQPPAAAPSAAALAAAPAAGFLAEEAARPGQAGASTGLRRQARARDRQAAAPQRADSALVEMWKCAHWQAASSGCRAGRAAALATLRSRQQCAYASPSPPTPPGVPAGVREAQQADGLGSHKRGDRGWYPHHAGLWRRPLRAAAVHAMTRSRPRLFQSEIFVCRRAPRCPPARNTPLI
jgi:hypothetical protein